MATLLDKTFDVEHGAVIVRVQDGLGNVGVHTIYVLGLGGQTVDDAIAQIMTDTDANTARIQAAFQAAGWTGGN